MPQLLAGHTHHQICLLRQLAARIARKPDDLRAKFIEHFTEGDPWAHLDLASMVWTDTDDNPLAPTGATGYGVRLLLDLALEFSAL